LNLFNEDHWVKWSKFMLPIHIINTIKKSILMLGSILPVIIMTSGVMAQTADDKGQEKDKILKLEKMADSPFRWILLNSKIKRNANTTAETKPVESKPAVVAAPPPPQNRKPTAPVTKTAKGKSKDTKLAAVPLSTIESVIKNPPPAAVSENIKLIPTPVAPKTKSGDANQENVIYEFADFENAEKFANGNLEAKNGSWIGADVNTFSQQRPNPVTASHILDKEKNLVRVNYDVPDTVGRYGGAGIIINSKGDGVNLEKMVDGKNVNGILVIEIDVTVATRLKISVQGPKSNTEGAYPYFILPVEPGSRTYGLVLADFRTPAWSANAPSIQEALGNVKAVAVEYSRGDAFGQGDKGSFWVGEIRFSDVVK
jgi:hypothetical protein